MTGTRDAPTALAKASELVLDMGGAPLGQQPCGCHVFLMRDDSIVTVHEGECDIDHSQHIQPVRPEFDVCRNCQADSARYVYWNETGGWSCMRCGLSDYPEAAE